MSIPDEPNSPPYRPVPKPRLSALLDAAPDATVIVDRGGAIVLGNNLAEKMFGYGAGGLVGLGIEQLMPERLRAEHREHRARYELGPRPRDMSAAPRLSGLRRDGGEFPIEVSLNPVAADDGALWTVAAIRDISVRLQRDELAHENERMAESDLLKATFFANMSHELRTPLNAVIGFAELLRDRVPGPLNAQQEEFLSTILCSARHLHTLINETLDLARIQAGKMAFLPTAFALHTVMDEVRDSMRVLAVQKRITLTAQTDPALDSVLLDALKLKQVLINFVANAIKFTPEGGHVSIRARPEDERTFRLEVEDTGPGIPSDQIGKLFVEFQQLDLGASRPREGTGLGLALSKRIAEAQGGRVGVSSSPGLGSVFYAVLPLRHDVT